MARTPRTFSRRGRAEAKARKNIGQDKPRKDVTEKAMQRIQRKAISEVSLTRSPSRFVGVLRLPRLRTTGFHGGGWPDDRTWREGVLSLKHRRCNETNQYHPTQQSPHENDWLPGNENVHGRTSRDESGSRLPILYCENPRHFVDILPLANWIIARSLCWWQCAKTSPCSGFWMQGIQIFVRSSRNFTGEAGFQSPNHSSFHSYGRTTL